MASTKTSPLKDSQYSSNLTPQDRPRQKPLDSEPTAQGNLAWELLNISPDGITLVTLDGLIVFANETTCRRYEKSLDTLIGTSIWNCVPSDKVAHWRIILNQVIETDSRSLLLTETRRPGTRGCSILFKAELRLR